MSCVLSQFFNYIDERNIKYTLKSYAINDRFHLDIHKFSTLGGSQSVHMDLSVGEANILKKQLEEFIAQNK